MRAALCLLYWVNNDYFCAHEKKSMEKNFVPSTQYIGKTIRCMFFPFCHSQNIYHF